MQQEGAGIGPFLRAGPDSQHFAAPRLAAGTELLGKFKDSGTHEDLFLIRRSDGAMLLVSELLYALAGGLQQNLPLPRLAALVSDRLDRELPAADAMRLIDRKLRPLGVIAGSEDHRRPTDPATKMVLLPPALVTRVATPLRMLFHPAMLGVCLPAAFAFLGWMASNGLLAPTAYRLSDPRMILGVVALTLAGAVFHEFGHAAAAIYSGARPGRIGAGLFVVWPALYTDLTDTYRLARPGRVRTDLGGIYFNLLFTLVLAGANATTGHPVFLSAALVQYLLIAMQFVPFAKLDGYYLLTDLSGVPDLFAAFRGAWRNPERTRGGLRSGAQLFVLYWVAATSIALAGAAVWLLLSGPDFLAGLAGLARSYATEAVAALDAGALSTGLAAGLGLSLVGLQLVGTAIVLGRLVLRVGAAIAER